MASEMITANIETETRKKWIIDQLLNNRAQSLGIVILIMCIVFSLLFPTTFFSYYNFTNILLSLSLVGMLAIGMVFLLVSGNFDLSIGASVAVSGAVTAYSLKHLQFLPFPVAMMTGVLVSVLAGVILGLVVAKVGVNALIASLAMMGILRGIAILIAGGGITSLPDEFVLLGQKTIFGIQMPVWYLIIMAIIGSIALSKTRFMRQLYFIGGNIKAAKLSGIDVPKVVIANFTIMGLISGLAGVIVCSRLNAAIGTLATGIEMQVLTAVIIGGASLAGGTGTVMGALMGALFMGVLGNIMIIAGIDVYYQSIIVGLVLVGAVTLDVQLRKRFGA